jgi:endoglucanase
VGTSLLSGRAGRAAAVAALAVALGGGATVGGAAPAAGSAFVRADQVGYAGGAAKRAYLMASAAEPGARFELVRRDGRVVYRARIGRSTGAWSAAFGHVYPLDFSAVRAPGRYTLRVRGPLPAAAPVRIAPGGVLFARPMANAVAFYRVQRDGPDFVRSPLRTAPAHLNDRRAMTYRTPRVDADGVFAGDLSPLGRRIDASGGWWDAGDYLKFFHTTAYADALLLAGVRDFPRQMGRGAGRADFTAEARFGARWLLRMWDDRTRTLYYQVGIGSGNDHTVGDHDIWRLTQADDTYGGSDPAFRYIRHRPVFRAGPPGSPVSPNLAGRGAAALALCAQVFAHSEPALARRCLRAAEHLFGLADTSPRGHLTTAIPFDFYPESSWRDDLELGATELALALAGRPPARGLEHRDPRFYLRQAARWARGYMDGANDAADTLNLYDVSGLADYDLVRAMRRIGPTRGLAVTQAGLLADMRRQLGGAIRRGAGDPFGFGYRWAQWDTTTHGAGMSVTASEYDQLTGSRRYAALSTRWLDNILGANAWGSSFIVGDGRVFPHCLQHQVANIVGSLDGAPPVLRGAAVEGPNSFAARGTLPGMLRCPAGGGDPFRPFDSRAIYRDDVQSYSTVEPAIDLTATSPLAFARQAAGRF